MTEFVTSARMRAIEAAAIASGTVTGRVLMERAGAGAVEAILRWRPDLDSPDLAVLVLCGPGNNGGDGYVMARIMAARGWRVTVCAQGDPERLPPDAAAARADWAGPVRPLDLSALQVAAAGVAPGQPLLIVDALFGIGQRAPLDDLLAPVNTFLDALLARPDAPKPVVVAVDLPTGYDADTGATLAARPMPADLIVTFHARKAFHTMPAAQAADLVIVDIGLSGAST